MTDWSKYSAIFLASAIALSVSACGAASSEKLEMEQALGSSNMNLDSGTAATITLGGKEFSFEYMLSCSAGTIVTMAVLFEER